MSTGVLRKFRETLRRVIPPLLIFSVGVNLLMLTVPLFMMQVFDRVLTSRSADTLMLLTVMALVAVLTLAALDAVRSLLLIRMSSWVNARLSGDVLAAMVASGVRRPHSGSMRALRDLETFRAFVSGPGMFPLMDAPWVPVFLLIVFLIHPSLGWLATVGAVVLALFAAVNEAATRRLLQEAGGASNRSVSNAEAAVRNADVIESMGMLNGLLSLWHTDQTQAVGLQARASARAALIGAGAKFVRLSLQIGMLAMGAYLAIGQVITPGAMVAAAIIMARALSPVEQAIGGWRTMVSAQSAYRRVRELLVESPPRGQGMPLPRPRGRLSVEGAGLIIPGRDEPVLRGISFSLEPGQALGLIGPSASGKSTLARLLVGTTPPSTGHVRLDGTALSRWDAEDRGAHVGYLPQDVELFRGTVRENIARMTDAEPQLVVRAAERARVHEMILRLPNGYDTQIGVDGTMLSGGQRQRIGLARALFGDPRLVVLDEPNSNLDRVGEDALIEALADLRSRGSTLVVITHRPRILAQFDALLVLRDGEVNMFGPRTEVMEHLTGSPAPAQSTPVGVPVGLRSVELKEAQS